jgi:ADP-dependent NAD(P)H-hydrate dehydratase
MCPSLPAESSPPTVVGVDLTALSRYPLLQPDAQSNKVDRGRVLIVGGSTETPGGIVLAGKAALRVGAGRVHLVTGESAALTVAVTFPEARVTGVPQTPTGAISPDAAGDIARLANDVDVVLIGSGALDKPASRELVERVTVGLQRPITLIIDAAALPAPDMNLRTRDSTKLVLLPNPGEMAELLGVPYDDVVHDPVCALHDAIRRHAATTALRDAQTWIATPGSDPTFCDSSANPALATAGSGDVLAGAVTGIAARGAPPLAAVLWAVHTHGRAGTALAERDGGPGLLASDLLTALPAELNRTIRQIDAYSAGDRCSHSSADNRETGVS